MDPLVTSHRHARESLLASVQLIMDPLVTSHRHARETFRANMLQLATIRPS